MPLIRNGFFLGPAIADVIAIRPLGPAIQNHNQDKGRNPMRKTTGLLLAVGLGLGAPAAQAYVGLCCAKCGGNMPMNIPGGGVPETHEFRVKISPMFMHMEGLRDGTDDVSSESLLGMPAMGKYMAVPTEMDMTMLNVAAGYSFSDNFFGGLMFMWKQNTMDMKFNAMMQGMTGRDGFTMESEGLGDTMLMTKYRLYTDDPQFPTRQVSLFFGLSLPTGSIDEKNSTHPVPMRQREQLPYGMQLGSGTIDPTFGILYQGSASPYWWGANLMVTPRFQENDRDYNLGDEARLDLYGMYQIRPDIVGQLQLSAQYRGAIEGEMDEAVSGASGRVTPGDPTSPYATPLWDPDNYGGRSIALTAGFQWQPAPLHIIDFQVRKPLWTDLNGPQLEEDFSVMLTWYVEIPTQKSIRYTGKKSKSRLGF
jgi:hypothetical protein